MSELFPKTFFTIGLSSKKLWQSQICTFLKKAFFVRAANRSQGKRVGSDYFFLVC